MATKRQRRKRRRRVERTDGAPTTARPSPVVLDDAQRPTVARAKAGRGEAPQALWGSFPLSELVVLIGLVLLVVGFFLGSQRGAVMMIVGLGLGSLAGVELAAREHFSGYRSHTLLLAGAVAIATAAVLAFAARTSPAVYGAAGLVAFGGAAWLCAAAFRRRSGGALFRFRGR